MNIRSLVVAVIVLGLLKIVFAKQFYHNQYSENYSNHNIEGTVSYEDNYDNENIISDFESIKRWLPFITVINNLLDIKDTLYFSSLNTRTANIDLNLVLKVKNYSKTPYNKIIVLFNNTVYQEPVIIEGYLQSSRVEAIIRNALNLDLPIFKPIMFPWDNYLKEYDVYLDYKLSFGNEIKNFLVKRFDFRVFYFFQ